MAATRKRWPLVAAGVGTLASGTTLAQTSLDFKFLQYAEGDDRTRVSNPQIYLNHDFGERGRLGLLLAYDSISGASPTGEFPTRDATASASSSGQIPMAEYSDTRKAAGLSYTKRFGSHLPTVDLSWSKEGDYESRGLSIEDAWEFAGGRSTLHGGIGITRDVIEPVTLPGRFDKNSDSLSLGWTQVLGPRDLLDLSLGLTRLQGYLDDPYKKVPIGTTVVPEHRPDTRSRRVAALKYAHHFLGRGAVKAYYRFYDDDWSIQAHTLELVHDQRVGRAWIVTPRLRFYRQGSASFFAYEFAEPQTYMSSDYRLSAFWSWLGGFGVSREIGPHLSVNAAATYQKQTGTDRVVPRATAPAPAALAPAASRPSLDATSLSLAGAEGLPGGVSPLEDDEEEEGGTRTVSPADMTTMTLTVGFTWRF